jgi:cytochrome c oxidase subunit 4
MSTHVVSWRVYLTVFAVLLLLTVITVEAAGHDFGPLNTVIALAIAVIKAALVVLYFMHLRYSGRLNHLVLFAAVVWLAILVLLTVSDYISRPWPITPVGS